MSAATTRPLSMSGNRLRSAVTPTPNSSSTSRTAKAKAFRGTMPSSVAKRRSRGSTLVGGIIMKLLRYGKPGSEKPGLLVDRKIRDLSGVISDVGADNLSPQSLEKIRRLDVNTLPEVGGSPRIGPCVASPGKFICVGLNYSDHAAESGVPVPKEHILFMKANSAICGPNDGIIIRALFHWESTSFL